MKKIVLASSSPRRRELLDKFNIEYLAVDSNIAEVLNPTDTPLQYAMGLAFSKAHRVACLYKNNIVIGADTIVVHNDKILEKPLDDVDAYRMIQILSGDWHEVISGICIINLSTNTKVIDYDLTRVKFRKLKSNTIDKYVKTKEPLDKSGAYGIQGFGGILVESIAGSYYNVIGLPLVKLDELLIKHFNSSLI